MCFLPQHFNIVLYCDYCAMYRISKVYCIYTYIMLICNTEPLDAVEELVKVRQQGNVLQISLVSSSFRKPKIGSNSVALEPLVWRLFS